MDLSVEQHEALRRGAEDFKRAMAVRSGLNLRVAKRVTAILRVGMVSLAVIAIIFLLMLWVMNSRMNFMVGVMNTMNAQFISMAKDMAAMRATITRMDAHVASLPVIVVQVGTMQETVISLNDDIKSISREMNGIQKRMTQITSHVDNMTQTFRVLDPGVQGIGVDVHRMSRPMKLFNGMGP
ncbi:MAG: hypothetical protein HQL75_12630 [Magnetococcales bacterium]|nr:hypothetical protein [Magnetococcales bacterium]